MSIIYAMARSREDLDGSPFRGTSLETLAASFTDAPDAEYDGPYPSPGQVLQGTVLARDPRRSSIGPKTVRLTVWVSATRS